MADFYDSWLSISADTLMWIFSPLCFVVALSCFVSMVSCTIHSDAICSTVHHFFFFTKAFGWLFDTRSLFSMTSMAHHSYFRFGLVLCGCFGLALTMSKSSNSVGRSKLACCDGTTKAVCSWAMSLSPCPLGAIEWPWIESSDLASVPLPGHCITGEHSGIVVCLKRRCCIFRKCTREDVRIIPMNQCPGI